MKEKYYYWNTVAMGAPFFGLIQEEKTDVGEERGFQFLGKGEYLEDALKESGFEISENLQMAIDRYYGEEVNA